MFSMIEKSSASNEYLSSKSCELSIFGPGRNPVILPESKFGNFIKIFVTFQIVFGYNTQNEVEGNASNIPDLSGVHLHALRRNGAGSPKTSLVHLILPLSSHLSYVQCEPTPYLTLPVHSHSSPSSAHTYESK